MELLMIEQRRFIEYAEHGGCAAKLDATRLQGLLAPFANDRTGWTDAGVATVGGRRYASSVDVVLPMIDDPALFGQIVVTHVLSDLYAVGATPVFALNILGVPKTPMQDFEGRELSEEQEADAIDEIDANVKAMLCAADAMLEEIGVARLGGHTLMLEALAFGLAATGTLPEGRVISNDAAEPGHLLVLTKPVGTSIATKCWKGNSEIRERFADVVEGMLRSNRDASEAMRGLERCACTDITGFGLLGHLQNMLSASQVSAVIEVAEVPVYESVAAAIKPEHSTRIFKSNLAFVERYADDLSELSDIERLLLIDAQISGGLLVSLPPKQVDSYLEELRERGVSGVVIGSVASGEPGRISLV
jgi:selenide,water dikinase